MKPTFTPAVTPPLRGIVQIDLGASKAAWQAFATAKGGTVSQIGRALLLEALHAQGEGVPKSAAKQQSPVTQQEQKTKRVELRMSESDHAAVAKLASHSGFSFQGYLLALVRNHANKQPQLAQAEINALGQSNLALLRVAQVLRAQGGQGTVALQGDIKKHINAVHQLLQANQERWTA